MKIEIILLLYNRPAHSLAVVESLATNGVTHVRAFVDGAPNSDVAATQSQLRDLLLARSDLSVDFVQAPTRRGVAESVRRAVSTTLDRADAVIVLEDDCVVREGGIRYFMDTLVRLRDDRRVRTICGYRYPCDFIHAPNSPFLLRRFCPWGWATWRDRWDDHEPDLGRLMEPGGVPRVLPGTFPESLAHLSRSASYRNNGVDIWSVAWAATHYLTDTFAVVPPVSLIDNVGFDGSGRHCTPTDAFITRRAETVPLHWGALDYEPENDRRLEQFLSRHHREIYPAP